MIRPPASRRALRLVGPIALLACACDREAPPAEEDGLAQPRAQAPWFEDVTASSGLDFTHVRGLQQRWWFPEIMGSGLCWLDYDRDGRIDLFLVQSGDLGPAGQTIPGGQLFRNVGEGRFADVTSEAGVGAPGYGMGCTAGDYDGDGDVDLYVTRVGPNVLYRNEGDGTFSDVTIGAGVGDPGWGTSAGFFDCDADGDLDLFVVNYVRWSKDLEIPCKSSYGERDYCAPNNYNSPSQCILYVNEGEGRFRDGSRDAGLSAAFGNGLGLALCDFDGDGRTDVYVSNDGMPNQLWMNRGAGEFVDEALVRSCAVNGNGASEASMGTVAGDFDEDGDFDLFITNLRGETNTYYENDGRGRMRDVRARVGLAGPSLQYTGFGDALADFDHDGLVDVFVANGRVGLARPHFSAEDVYAEPKQLFRGGSDGRFEEVPHGGLSNPCLGNSRGLAVADYDDDGDLDIAVLENHGRARLLRNVGTKRGHWTLLAVLNGAGAPALGARVTIDAGARLIRRDVSVCTSYCSAGDARVHCGLGATSELTSVEVRWPDGSSESFGPLPADRIHEIRQSRGRTPR